MIKLVLDINLIITNSNLYSFIFILLINLFCFIYNKTPII